MLVRTEVTLEDYSRQDRVPVDPQYFPQEKMDLDLSRDFGNKLSALNQFCPFTDSTNSRVTDCQVDEDLPSAVERNPEDFNLVERGRTLSGLYRGLKMLFIRRIESLHDSKEGVPSRYPPNDGQSRKELWRLHDIRHTFGSYRLSTLI
jgi:hypothetical protein